MVKTLYSILHRSLDLTNKEIKQQQNELKKVKDFKNSLNKNINDIKF